MLSYLVHRLLIMIPTLLAISALTFIIIQLPPGDYLETYIAELESQGESVDVEKIQQLKEQYGLTVLMAEQNFHQAIRIANRGYIIVHGEIVFDGRTVDELQNNPLVKSYYLGTG